MSTAPPGCPLLYPRSTGQILREWDPDGPWGSQRLAAAAFGPGGSLLLLTAARSVVWVRPGAGEGEDSVLGTFSVKVGGGSYRCCRW